MIKNETKVINVTVLVEVLNAVKKTNYEGDIEELLSCLLDLDIFDFLDVSDYEDAMKWFKYYDKSIKYI